MRRTSNVPTSYGAPPAGPDAAGPRPDLRGHRLGVAALLARPEEQLRARRVLGFVAGLAGGLAVGVALLWIRVPALVAIPAAAAVDFALTLWLPTRVLAPSDRRLLDIGARLVAHTGLTWRRGHGRARMPRTEEATLLWLASRPETTTDPDALDIEVSLLMALGRYAAARERAERLPGTTPWWQFVRELALAQIEFESGGRGELSAAREAAARVHGPRRSVAAVTLGLEDATRAMIRGDDWGPPIQQAVAETGPAILGGVAVGLARTRAELPWLLGSALALGTILSLAAVRPSG